MIEWINKHLNLYLALITFLPVALILIMIEHDLIISIIVYIWVPVIVISNYYVIKQKGRSRWWMLTTLFAATGVVFRLKNMKKAGDG